MLPSEESLHDKGEQARFIHNLPLKMFVFDRKKTLIALTSVPGATGSDFTMIVIEDTDFAAACCILFDHFWEKAMTREEMIEELGDNEDEKQAFLQRGR